ncbi:unnamed protein product [Coffea canephora]|uniref:Flavin-containing monooxygenase n=1 Tax=Coffea canephora TaxID=49390 RepID=A0A068UK22_COFCA|nr:unnamed protein product [Coffea canephora]
MNPQSNVFWYGFVIPTLLIITFESNDLVKAQASTNTVIGAGVSGLVTARELQGEGHQVVVYEKSDQIGGIWVYDPKVESDPLGLDPNGDVVHSSLYNSLQTNLTTQLIEFTDYPFIVSKNNGKKVCFPHHEEVLKFLNKFAIDFGLNQLIRLNSEVINVEQKDDHWIVESKTRGELDSEELFEAVVVCNGHYTIPKLIVVVIGYGPSAYDIGIEISKAAKEVHLSSRFPQVKVTKMDNCGNMWLHKEVEYCYENGEIASKKDGAFVDADIILHCTGYKYDFPFLNTKGIITIDDNRVDPLYKHVFPPQFAPTLSFVGIPSRTVNFRMMELQAKWVAQFLSRQVTLPSREKMLADVEEYYRLPDETGIPKHHTHTLPFGVDAVRLM